MSTTLFQKAGLVITKFAGPAVDEGSRTRYSLVDVGGGDITLSREQWEALGEWFSRDCSVECEGPHLDLTWDQEVT